MRQYIFRYMVAGVDHTPWLPSCIVWAQSHKEARRKVKKEQEEQALARYGEKRSVIPLYGSRYYKPGDFLSVTPSLD